MFYVYILRGKNFNEIYTGFTEDLIKRVTAHDSGKSVHTNKFKPWDVVAYLSFKEQKTARDFEKYLKTGSGIAFTRKHLL